MLKNGVEINQNIVITENPIEKNIPFIDYLKHLKSQILANLNQKNVLNDIDNLLYTEAQKDKIKATLIPKLITLIDLETEKQVESSL